MTSDPQLNFVENSDIFRTLIEQSPTAVGLYVGREMRIRLANDAMLKVWGKTSAVINQTLHVALPELEGQPFHTLLDNVYTSGIAYEATEDPVDLVVDGKLQTFYYNFTYKPLKNPEGKVWGILNTATDVTELARTRKKLTESEESTRFALEAGELGTWNLDPLNSIITWDDRCKQLYGFSKADAITYAEVLKHIHPDDAERVHKDVEKALDPKSGGNYLTEFRTIGAEDNTLRWLRCKGKAYFDDNGQPYRFAGTALDISREIADTKQQKRLTSLIENSDDFVCVAELDGQINYINKAGLEIIGLDKLPEHLSGEDFFLEEDKIILIDFLRPALKKIGKWTGNVRYRNLKTNEVIPAYINAFRIDGPVTGKPIGYAWVSRDLRPEIAADSEKNRLLALLDNSSVFVALSNLDGFVTYVNTYGRQMLGLNKPEDALRPNIDYAMPGEMEKIIEDHQRSINEKGVWAGRIVYRNFKSGEAVPVEGKTILVYDPITGQPNGRATIARDLRQEIADKKALEESQHLLYTITSASPTALWMSDDEGNITYANQTWTEWTGQLNNEILGTGWTNAILPQDRERVGKVFFDDLQARRHYDVDFRIKHKNGEIRWCKAEGNPQYDASGNFTGYIGSCADVTEKILIEQQLNQKNQLLNDQIKQFAFVNDFMPVQLWTATTTGELDYVNRRTEDFFGTTAKNIVGDAWQTFVHPDDFPSSLGAWEHSLKTGLQYQIEFRLRDKDGNYKWHLARALPFKTNGRIVKWFGTNTDIDEQKQMQRQKDDFLGIASHELKTPVTSIKAYTQVLGAMLKKEGEMRKADMVNRMDVQINRLTNLIADLLDVTKINSGKLQFNKAVFDVNQMVREIMEDMQHTTHRHKLVEDFTETGKIYTDKERIGQVITNLISNAIKYSPNADTIIISTRLKDNHVLISVKDFGIGISADKKSKVFEQFYRVSGTRQHTFPGLGLGLYISSEIIKREGGRIWVDSTEGAGSTFSFTLPA